MSSADPTRWVAVFEHDGDTEREGGPDGPFVFESYLNESTKEAAQSRIACTAARNHGASRLAWLDFDLGGEETEPHVVVASFDGVYRDRGPLVWESVLKLPHSTRTGANTLASRLECRYGASRIARLVFDEAPKN